MRGMSAIVRVVTQMMAGMLFLYGGYIIVHGHLTPGGGFAGGVLIAAAFILVSLAFGSVEEAERSGYVFSSVFESFGGLMFLGLALAGYVTGDFFFSNVVTFFLGRPLELYSGGIIPLANIAIGIKVGAGLVAIFLAMGASRFVMKE
jgi:multicomponent Na+:H+ antiporter subunit B